MEVYKLTSSYYSESVYEVGWNKLLIKDIQFSFNGKVLPFHSSKESVREAGYEVEVYDNECDSIPIDGINRRWFYTLFSMTPHEESTLNVKYKVYANTSAGIYSDGYDFSYYSRREESAYEGSFVVNSPFTSRYFTQNFRILYDFTPAKHFGKGRNYVIKIDIDLNNLEDANMRGENGYYYDINGIHKDIYVSNPDKIDPINIKIWYSMKNNEDRINTIIERYKIPESEFVTTLNKNNLEIDFKSPRFVSDIACDVDTISVKDIKAEVVFSDGSNKYYIYKPQDIYNRVDTRLKSPLFLTITDLYNDGTGSAEISENLYQNWFFSQDKDFDTPRLKVQKIKFSFDPKLDASAVCKNIKVLDARFIRSEN